MEKETNYTRELASEFYRGTSPECIVDSKIKEEFEKRLGISLPNDYYDYINSFGDGCYSDCIKIFNIFRENGIHEYFDEVSVNEDTMTSCKKMRELLGFNDVVHNVEDGEIISEPTVDYKVVDIVDFDEVVKTKIIRCGLGLPYNFSENGSYGLIYFGYADDFNFFWNYDCEKFTVVVFDEDNSFYEFDMSFTEFLYDLLHGKMPHITDCDDNWTYEEYK